MGSGFGTVRGYYVSVDNYSFIDNIHAEIGKLFLSVRSLKMICCGFSAFEYAAFSQRKSVCAYAYEDRFSYFALLFGSILHSSLVVYNTVIILFPSGIVKQTAGIIRVKKQAVCELFVKIRKKSEKGLTK